MGNPQEQVYVLSIFRVQEDHLCQMLGHGLVLAQVEVAYAHQVVALNYHLLIVTVLMKVGFIVSLFILFRNK